MLEFNTSTKANDIRDCLVDRGKGRFSTSPYKDGWLVSKLYGVDGIVIWAVKAYPEDGHTHVVEHAFKHVDSDDDALPCLDPLPRS